VGVADAFYGGLGVGQAIQHAMGTVWAVARNVRSDPIRSRIRSLVLLCVLGSASVVTTLVSAWGRQWRRWGRRQKLAWCWPRWRSTPG
jgi:membrane protein